MGCVRFIVLFLLLSISCLMGQNSSFDTEKGFLKYHVFGYANIGDKSTLVMDGGARLAFKDFGYIRLEEESRKEYLRGNLEGNHFVFRYKKREGTRVLDFDLNNLQILEYTASINPLAMNPLDYNATISGLECDFYGIDGYYQECRHKGVVLFSQYRILDVYYAKVATDIDLNSDINDTLLKMPDFPQNTLVPYAANTTKQQRPKEIPDVLRSITREISETNATKHELALFVYEHASRWKKRIFRRIFITQQNLLPELFAHLQESRECFSSTTDLGSKSSCLEPLRSLIYPLNLSRLYEPKVVTQENYGVILEQLNRDIFMLAPKIGCIKQSKNIEDINQCQ